jgi:hypothetical protein
MRAPARSPGSVVDNVDAGQSSVLVGVKLLEDGLDLRG